MANKPGTNRQDDLILRAAGEGIYGLDNDGLTTFVLDTGHFALEEDGELIAAHMRRFLDKHVC